MNDRHPSGPLPLIDALERRVLFAAGALDKYFGTNGIAAIDFSNSIESLQFVAPLQDGRLLGIGERTITNLDPPINSKERDVILIRTNTDGSLDRSFAQDGVASASFVTDVPSYDYSPMDLTSFAISPAGEVYVAGGSSA